uniref:Uncharacterized protein n=1 Tax=Arundo donax TaxID=35708 RepID=A0A0A8ZR61_ARUDO
MLHAINTICQSDHIMSNPKVNQLFMYKTEAFRKQRTYCEALLQIRWQV